MERKYWKSKLFTILVVIVLLVAIVVGVIHSVNKPKTISYKNPVGGMTKIGDPFVLKDGETYYMYATSEASYGFKVWKSNNLVDWKEKGDAYDHYQQSKQWARGDFWAPEVTKYKDHYYMVFSARDAKDHLRISIAKSDNPLGPFKDLSIDIIKEPGSYIDGDFFFDNNGIPYLYYVKDCSENIVNGNHVSQIFVQKMNHDLTQLEGHPKLLLQPDQKWEGLNGDYRWNEGPFVLKHDDKYYLMYSANFYASSDYGIGYAVADHPMGPFKKSAENPILSKDLKHGISGPGHNCVTIGPDNKTLYIIYHTHTVPEAPSGDRQMNLDRLYFENGKLKVDGPSYTEKTVNVK